MSLAIFGSCLDEVGKGWGKALTKGTVIYMVKLWKIPKNLSQVSRSQGSNQGTYSLPVHIL